MSTDYSNLKLTMSHFCVVDDYYFVMYPSPLNLLMKKTNYGDPVMTYPFSDEMDLSAVNNQFIGLDYDGVNFWSLEKVSYGSSIEKRRRLRRWRIENFMCVLKDSWILSGQGGEDINGRAFCIEHYHDFLAEDCGLGTSYTQSLKLTTPTSCYFHSGDHIAITDSVTGDIKDAAVNTKLGSDVVNLQVPLDTTLSAGSKVSHFRRLYFFNNQAPTIGASSAALYIWSIPITTGTDPLTDRTPSYITCDTSGVYEGTQAAHFCTISGVDAVNSGYETGLISYIRGMQLLLKKPMLPAGTTGYPDGVEATGIEYRSNINSMLIDTLINTAKTEIYTVYALSSSQSPNSASAVNVYRLQNKYTYATDGSWSTYNYVVSTLDPVITSLTLSMEPSLLPANGTSKANIYAVLRDQYGYAINDKTVTFQVEDALGGRFCAPTVTITPCTGGDCWISGDGSQARVVTGTQNIGDGAAVIGWLVGTSAGFPIVTATVSE